jgi:ElaB/YqjD/DUF883 family membrane-anchored ribosome-binding protein
MSHSNTSNESIAEALSLLEEAAKQKKDELKGVMANKYASLKGLVLETESSLVKSITDAGRHAVDTATHARDVGVEKAREVACDVDKHVHQNPWPYVGGAAAISLLLGYLLGRNRN